MKKMFLILGVTGMVMSGCMNTDVMDKTSDVQSGKIAFDTHVSKPTKAERNTDIETSNLQRFFVAGSYQSSKTGANYIQIFNNAKIEKEGDKWIQKRRSRSVLA